MLTPKDLSNMRSDVTETLVDTCYIIRNSTVIDSSGGWAEVPGTVGTVNARIDPMTVGGASSPFYAEQEAGKALYRLSMPWNTDLHVTDRIEINGITAEILQVHDDHSDRIVIRAVCAKVSD